MIKLSKISGEEIHVNPDLVRSVQQLPDTILTFVDGHTMMVKESPAEISSRIIEFRKRILTFESEKGAEL